MVTVRRHPITVALLVLLLLLGVWKVWGAVAPQPQDRNPQTVDQPGYCKLMGYGTMESRIDVAVAHPEFRTTLGVPNPDRAPFAVRDDLTIVSRAVASDYPEQGRAAARRLDTDAATRCPLAGP